MAKSTRSKVKRSFRAKKRTTGIYAATEAARLNRLSAKLLAVASAPKEDEEQEETETMEEDGTIPVLGQEGTDADSAAMEVELGKEKRISTHGPRGSRREEWRKSKGLDPRPSIHGMNRQGGLSGRRKAGRSQRRR